MYSKVSKKQMRSDGRLAVHISKLTLAKKKKKKRQMANLSQDEILSEPSFGLLQSKKVFHMNYHIIYTTQI